MIKYFKTSVFLALLSFRFLAQENLRPLNSNLSYIYEDLQTEKKLPELSAHKTQSVSLFLPFIEDFYYAPTNNYPDQNKWSDQSAYVNQGYGVNPPSIGVATFDGLNKYGFPYYPSLINNALTRESDTLTSREINLLTTSTSQTLQPSDSVALTFYYQARGFGDSPETIDSLILDLFSPGKNRWINRVWFSKGNINGNIYDTVFKRGFVKIDSAHYLKDGFKFRFRNKSTGTGNFDHWHLDYVYLNKGRSLKADTVYEDLTFGYVPTSLLRDYCAMPYEQYIPTELAPKISVKIRNSGKNPINMTYRHRIDTASQQVKFYDGGAFVLGQYKKIGYSNFVAHANPVVAYTFAPMPDSLDYKMKHYVFESGAPTDLIAESDTVVQYQRFRNYYAFDDGGAEAGYYLNVAQAKLAIKINVNIADSFLAARIYFDPVTNVNALMNSTGFRINIWSAGTNGPGTVLYRDTIYKPKYFNSFPDRAFAEYKLKRQQLLQPGTYYIGFEQLADYMTIGFDRNTDRSLSTFYNIGKGWEQSTEKGSVMIRPVFGKTLPRYQNIRDYSALKNNFFKVFPNPVSDQLIVRSESTEKASYQLYNTMGQLIEEADFQTTDFRISTDTHNNGIYLLILKINNSAVQQQKIIIQH